MSRETTKASKTLQSAAYYCDNEKDYVATDLVMALRAVVASRTKPLEYINAVNELQRIMQTIEPDWDFYTAITVFDELSN